jgi:hypothetical protein
MRFVLRSGSCLEISRFFGIVISMFHAGHSPPHFHARYGVHRAIIEIESSMLLGGSLPPRPLGLVMEWAAKHRAELRDDWRLARQLQPLLPIPPLE